ncbi:hypothetical protein [Flavicella marina]|uniref:hypothetical protein n=1 Tax=Flavicella marina TaxID=1475951 RepID=UPI001264337C|nr:hypothetical protein [Flavicella marina]
MKARFTIMLALLLGLSLNAQDVQITKNDKTKIEVTYKYGTFGSRDIRLNTGEKIVYREITEVATANFEAYERAMKKIGKEKYKHVSVKFTGDENLYALKLEQLQSKRLGIETTRAAGGLITLIGVLSGDRQLTSAGLLTSYIGDTNSMENNQKSIAVQTEMLKDLDERTRQQEKQTSEKEQWVKAFGKENIEALEALMKKEHKRAEALANVAELSENTEYQLSAVWLKAMIAKEQGDSSKLLHETNRLVVLDDSVKSIDEVEKEINLLLKELNSLRV